MRWTRKVVPTLAIGIWLAGCEAPREPEVREVQVRDSAGVTIVESPAPGAVWTLATEPELAIGGLGCPAHCEFEAVEAAARLEDGRIVVFDRGAREARFFDETGAHLRTVGGEGAGPGEFRRFSEVVIAPDRFAVHDRGNGRVTFLSLEGDIESTHNLRNHAAFQGTVELVGLHRDGVVVARLPEFRIPGGTGYAYVRDTLVVMQTDLEGERIDTIDVVPGGEGLMWSAYEGSFMNMTMPFAHSVDFALSGGRVVVGHSETHGVRAMGLDGVGDMIMRGAGSRPRDLTASVRSEHVDGRVERAEERGDEDLAAVRQTAEEQLDMVPTGHSIPVRDRVMADTEGNVWVRAYERPGASVPRRWTIFDTAGVAHATIEIPAGLRLTHLGADRVTGVLRDSLGVETVEVRRIQRR